MVEDLNLNFGEKVVENKPFPKKILIICIAAFLVVLTGILLFVFAFPHKTNVDFDFYLNNNKVNEDLTVLFSYDDKNFEVKTVKDKLTVSLPKNKDVSLEVLTIGYQYKKSFFIDGSKYDIKINKATSIAELEGEQEIVQFYIYKYPNTTQIYNKDLIFNLTCNTSKKTDMVKVNGSYSYTKPDDCGSLSVKLVSDEFKPINQTCGSLCKIILYDFVDVSLNTKVNDYRNNILVFAKQKGKSALEDVTVSLYKENIFVIDGLTDKDGLIYFTNLLVGDYKIVGNYKKGSKNYQAIQNVKLENLEKDLNVNLEFKISSGSGSSGSSGSSSTKILEDNTHKILIKTYDDYNIPFRYQIYAGKDLVAEDVNITPFATVDLEDGNYYITIIPEINKDFNKNYNPVFLEEINLDSDKTISLRKLDLNSNVFLSLPTYLDSDKNTKYKTLQYGVDLKIYDFDSNVIIYDYVNVTDEIHKFILDKSKKYIIKAEKNNYYKSDIYEFKNCKTNDYGVCIDSLSIYLENKYLELPVKVYFKNILVKDYNLYYSTDNELWLEYKDVNLNYNVPYYFKVNAFTSIGKRMKKIHYYSAPLTFRKNDSILNIFLDYEKDNFKFLNPLINLGQSVEGNFFLDDKLTKKISNNLNIFRKYYLPINMYANNTQSYYVDFNNVDVYLDSESLNTSSISNLESLVANNDLGDINAKQKIPGSQKYYEVIYIKQYIYEVIPQGSDSGFLSLNKNLRPIIDNNYYARVDFNILAPLENILDLNYNLNKVVNKDFYLFNNEILQGVDLYSSVLELYPKYRSKFTNYIYLDSNVKDQDFNIDLSLYIPKKYFNCKILSENYFKINLFNNNFKIIDDYLNLKVDLNLDYFKHISKPIEYSNNLSLNLDCDYFVSTPMPKRSVKDNMSLQSIDLFKAINFVNSFQKLPAINLLNRGVNLENLSSSSKGSVKRSTSSVSNPDLNVVIPLTFYIVDDSAFYNELLGCFNISLNGNNYLEYMLCSSALDNLILEDVNVSVSNNCKGSRLYVNDSYIDETYIEDLKGACNAYTCAVKINYLGKDFEWKFRTYSQDASYISVDYIPVDDNFLPRDIALPKANIN